MKTAAGRWVILFAGVLLMAAADVGAQTLPTTSKDRPVSRPAKLLGETFESAAAGITFSAPAGCREIRKGPGDAELVEYVDEAAQWDLKVALWTTDAPLPLKRDPQKSDAPPGLMDSTLDQTRLANPGARVLRDEITATPQGKIGRLAFRYTVGTQRRLTQIALVQKSPQLYYIFNLTTPGASDGPGHEPSAAQEQRAVETFGKIVDSIHLLDRSKIRQDQVERLFRTRALFGQWTLARIKSILIPRQWLRVVRDGHDVGYSYLVERPERRGNSDGMTIGIRSRLVKEDGGRIDTESWLYANIDREHGSWSTGVRVSDAKGKLVAYGTEIGASDQTIDGHRLTVKTISKSADTEPVKRDLPPWYLPQAFSRLLPRLLPLNEARTYLFANYVSDKREVMSRYVEVLAPKVVSFNGHERQAVTIHDRYGLEGTITTHYFTPEGTYLGSETITQKSDGQGVSRPTQLLILPSTEKELLKIWSHADLSEPSLPGGHTIGR
jgi:hypothetical protein